MTLRLKAMFFHGFEKKAERDVLGYVTRDWLNALKPFTIEEADAAFTEWINNNDNAAKPSHIRRIALAARQTQEAANRPPPPRPTLVPVPPPEPPRPRLSKAIRDQIMREAGYRVEENEDGGYGAPDKRSLGAQA